MNNINFYFHDFNIQIPGTVETRDGRDGTVSRFSRSRLSQQYIDFLTVGLRNLISKMRRSLTEGLMEILNQNSYIYNIYMVKILKLDIFINFLNN